VEPAPEPAEPPTARDRAAAGRGEAPPRANGRAGAPQGPPARPALAFAANDLALPRTNGRCEPPLAPPSDRELDALFAAPTIAEAVERAEAEAAAADVSPRMPTGATHRGAHQVKIEKISGKAKA
jgi:hypothetical protein